MDKSSSVIAALDAGKLPSQQQINSFIDWLLDSALTQVEPSDTSGELSAQGKVLVQDVRDLLNAYKLVGEHKNADNCIQEALWHLSQADISSTTVQGQVDTDQASKDAQALARALKTVLKIVWTNFSSESGSVFHDFASFMRLAMADAAEYVSKSAGSTAEGLRQLDAQIEQGERNELGVRKSTDEESPEDRDARVRFERGMDTAKVAGSKAIGAGQAAIAASQDLANRTNTRLRDALFKVSDRAQENEEYHSAVSTIFDVLHKWVHKSLDTAGDVNTDTSLESFIDDPTEEQHLIKAIRTIRTFIERLADGKSLDDVFSALRIVGVDIQQDQHLRDLFDEILAHLRRSVDEQGYVRSEEAEKTREDLKAKWQTLHDADTSEGQKWRDDWAKLKTQWDEFSKALEAGEDSKRIANAQAKLAGDIEQSFITAASAGAQAAADSTWVWQDLFNAYLPRILSIVKDIPIPRTEFKDNDVEFVLENIDISTFALLPGHAYIRNITDIDIKAPSQGEAQTAVGSLTRVYVQGMQLALREVSFYFHDKNTSMGPGEFTGLLEFTLPPQGIDVDVVVRTLPNSPEGLQQREKRKSFLDIQRVDVKVSDQIDIKIRESNHAIISTVFRPLIISRFRETLQTILADNIRASLEWGDAFAWDVGNRAEVFSDAGLPRGPSLIAGFWSELGHLQKGETGLLKGWKATGSGLIKEGGNTNGAKFAMGAEPQVLSGEKRGPIGTFSQPLSERVGADVDAQAAAEGAKGAVKDISAQAKATVQQGVQTVRSFKQAVQEKAEEEEAKPGWGSSAFDV